MQLMMRKKQELNEEEEEVLVDDRYLRKCANISKIFFLLQINFQLI